MADKNPLGFTWPAIPGEPPMSDHRRQDLLGDVDMPIPYSCDVREASTIFTVPEGIGWEREERPGFTCDTGDVWVFGVLRSGLYTKRQTCEVLRALAKTIRHFGLDRPEGRNALEALEHVVDMMMEE